MIALGGASSADRPGARLLRRVPAGVKLAGLASLSVALFFVSDAVALAGAFGLSCALAWSVGGAPLLRTLWPVGLMLAIACAAHIALGDWRLGLTMVLRVGAVLLLATAISAATGISEMLSVLDRLTAPLRLFGVPTRPISIACLLTLRFAPMLGARWQALAEAWRARSPRAPRWRLVTPFTISALEDADRTADALAARGAFLARILSTDLGERLIMEKDVARIALFAALIAALGLAPQIVLPFAGGVPITAQTLGVMLAGLMLGPWRGAGAVLVFMLVVVMGAPLLAGGRGGLGVLAGPTVGFFLGWPLAAIAIGLIDRALRPRGALVGGSRPAYWAGSSLLYCVGIVGLSLITEMGLEAATLAVLIFIPGDVLKAVIAAFVAREVRRARPDLIA